VKSAGLILAAGESRRMGFPKALLDYRGETFLDRLTRLFAERCDPVIVVLGARAGELRARAASLPGVHYVVNDDWAAGQTSSFLRGLREIPAEAPGILFTLVDHPAVAPETLDALLAAGGPLRIPRFNTRRGHPIWLSRRILAEFQSLPAGAAARDIVRAHYPEATWLDVDDPGILADIDDPAAYRTLTGVSV
jgi:CTP:molybdopterin cytidylyltransferase MocA